MRFDELPDFFQDLFRDHWDAETRSHWGDISNFIETWQEDQTYLHLANNVEGMTLDEAMMPDSDFALAYADWAKTGYDRDDISYAQMLYEADYFDSLDDAKERYDIA